MSEHGRASRACAVLFMGAALALARPVWGQTVELKYLERRALSLRGSLASAAAHEGEAAADLRAAQAASAPTLVASAGADLAPATHLLKISDRGGDYLVPGVRSLAEPASLEVQPRYSATLTLSARLYDFGRARALAAAARANADAAANETSVARAAIVSEVRQAYANWLLAVGRRDLAQRDLADAEQLRGAIDGRIEVGASSEPEGTSAKLEEGDAALLLAQAEASVLLARLDLERASATQLAENAEPEASWLTQPVPRAVASADPQLAALEQRRRAFQASAEAELALARPSLTGGVEAGVRGQASTFFPVYRVGVMFTVPIWDGGARRASADSALAKANDASALAREESAENQLRSARARAILRSSEASVVLAEQLLSVARHAVVKAEERQRLQSDYVQGLIAARQQRSRTELALLQARVERLRAIFALAPVQP